MLSSFSPVGSSKYREDSVAEILPRTSTPAQSSSVARHVVSALSSDDTVDSSTSKDANRALFTPRADERTSVDQLRRLSISGRLSSANTIEPITPGLNHSGNSTIRGRFLEENSDILKSRFDSSHEPQAKNVDWSLRPRLEMNSAPVPASVPVPVPASSVSVSRGPSDDKEKDRYLIPELVKSMVERAIADSVQELRNDMQNLHVDLIKQTLAQQVN